MRRGTRRIATTAVLLAWALLTGGCVKCRTTLAGFPVYPLGAGATGLRDVSAAIKTDLDRIDAAVEETAGSTQHAAATEGAPPVPVQTAALRAIVDAHLALAAERISTTEPPQIDTPPYPPLVLYPRLTAPAIVEAERVRLPDGDALRWIVPVVLDTDAFFWDLSAETVWLGRSPRRNLGNDPRGQVSGWLVAHGEQDVDRRRPVELAPYQLPVDPVEVTLSNGKTLALPHVKPDRWAGAYALPVGDAQGTGLQPGYYDIQLFPRIREIETCETAWGQSVAALLDKGDWYGFREAVRAFRGARFEGGRGPVERDLLRIAEGIDGYLPTRFDPYLNAARSVILHWAWRTPDPRHASDRAPTNVDCMLARFLARSHQPIPVLLDDPATKDEPFSFIAAGDLQFHDDRTHLHRFLRLVGAYDNTAEVQSSPHLSPEIRARLASLKFIVIAGDLGDGEGLSSSPHTAIVAGLGLLPPRSPYDTEFPFVRDELERARIPVVAVPGNHDGFANYGGLLNNAFDWAGEILKVPPEPIRFLTYPVGHGLQEVGQRLPTLVKVGRLARHPYYDGLVQWVFEFGPLNVAFDYRGCSFLAMNTYDLPQLYRDQIGPIANNWGGGVDPADAIWFDAIVRRQNARNRQTGEGPGLQFVFMHHDPRAAVPDPGGSGKEVGYGHYDDGDTPFNTLTFGWGGINYSALNPLFVPVVTPVGANLTRLLTTGDRFNQEWMGPSWVADEHCHHARLLVEAMNDNLEGSGQDEGGIHHVFFGHNDDVAEGTWASVEQGGAVFHKDPGQRWTGCPYGKTSTVRPFFKQRTVEPFDWGLDMKVDAGRNAKVTRLDDLGDNGSDDHGFHLVTVYPRPGQKPIVQSTHVAIPDAAPSTPPAAALPRRACGCRNATTPAR